MTHVSATTNPLDRLVRKRRTLEVISTLVIIGALYWTVRPLRPLDLPVTGDADRPALSSEHDATADAQPLPPLDPSTFAAARLWNPPPPSIEEKKEEESRAVKRPALELVGIIKNEDGECHAAIYHLDKRELLILRSGDRIEPFLVVAITDETVRLEDGRAVASLSVRKER